MAKKATSKSKKVKETAAAYMTTSASTSGTYWTSITSKGQLVIPAAVRRKFGITPKTRIVIYEEGQRIILKPVTHEAVDRLCGSLADGPDLVKALLDERAKDREREDAKFNRFG